MSIAILSNQLSGIGRRRGRSQAPRVLVIGNVGNGNTGDEALLAVTLAALEPDAQPTVVSRNPSKVTSLHQVPAVAMNPWSVARAVASSHALVVVGGGMFGPGLPPLVRLLPHLLHAAELAGRDVAYAGIGVYPGAPADTLAALRRASHSSRGVTVRDRASARLLDPTTPPPCIGDLAVHLSLAPDGNACNALRAAGVDTSRPLLLLTPKAGTTPEKTRNVVLASVQATQHWIQRGGSVAGLALAEHADHGIPSIDTDSALIAQIAGRAGIPIPSLGPNLHPALAKAIVARAAAVFGLRFHGVVFAAATNVPATSFAWEPKTAAFLTEQHLPALREPIGLGQLTSWLDDCRDLIHPETTRPVQ